MFCWTLNINGSDGVAKQTLVNTIVRSNILARASNGIAILKLLAVGTSFI